ncbi:MAG TPA: ABC transporter permease [Anaerolineaceae bacterium]|jgi:simple sugar transport system permease protein|nr:ABC transporter permease [Anaerolineaceae bacterium]
MNLLTFIDSNVLSLAVTMLAPLLVAALGELIIEQSGISNMSIEGMMVMGGACGFLASYFSGSQVVGMVAAMISTALMGLLLAVFAIKLRGSQLIVGLGLYVLGMGLPSLLYRLFIGIRLIAPQIPILPKLPIPLLSDIPYIGPIFFKQPVLVYVAYLLVPVIWFFLYKTRIGIRVRATGENPRAVDTLGINVFSIRYACTILGSALIGLGGAYLPMVLTGTYSDGMVGGRGWIALMLVIFGRWKPLGIVGGAFLFAYVEALQFRLSMLTSAVPSQFFLMLPYIVAILVLIRIYRNAEAPMGLSKPYDRELRA